MLCRRTCIQQFTLIYWFHSKIVGNMFYQHWLAEHNTTFTKYFTRVNELNLKMDQCVKTMCKHLFPLSLHSCVLHLFMHSLSLRPVVFWGQVKRLGMLSGESDPVGLGYVYVVLESALDCQDAFKLTRKCTSGFKLWNKAKFTFPNCSSWSKSLTC